MRIPVIHGGEYATYFYGGMQSSPNWHSAIRTLLNKNSVKIKKERKEEGVEVKY